MIQFVYELFMNEYTTKNFITEQIDISKILLCFALLSCKFNFLDDGFYNDYLFFQFLQLKIFRILQQQI